MSITMEASVLARVMKNAAAVTATRNIIPILANVRLEADGEALHVCTTDLDIEYRESVPLGAPGELAITVDSKRLSAVASAAGKGSQLTLEMAEKRLLVKNGRSRWTMPTLPVVDFPTIPFEGGEASFEMAGKDLAAMLDRVMWSVSTDPARPFLHGPLLHGENGKVTLAATNGHTMARIVSTGDFQNGAPEVILHPGWCRFVETLARDAESVRIEWDGKKARATIGPVTLVGKVIEGTFPDYRRVIPPDVEQPVTIDPETLRATVRKVQVLATEKTRMVKVEREADKLVLTCTSPDNGVAQGQVPADCADGFTTGFNAQYLDQTLTALGGDSVVIHQADAGAPARFERTVPDGMLCVIMPMRV